MCKVPAGVEDCSTTSAWRAHDAIGPAGSVKTIRCVHSHMKAAPAAAFRVRTVTRRSSGRCGKWRPR
jgi:hypothetical protein